MKFLTRILLSVVPILFSLSLWLDHIWDGQHLWIAIGMTIYSALVFWVYLSLNKTHFEGVIEFKETQEGSKTFQLILDKDPDTFHDQDKVTFLLKKIAG